MMRKNSTAVRGWGGRYPVGRWLAVSVFTLLAGLARLLGADPLANEPFLVRDINPLGDPVPSGPDKLTSAGGRLFYTDNDGTSGLELWVSNGTEEGTNLVRDIRPGRESSSPATLTAAGDRVFFWADDGTNGRDLWVSDGTEEGTYLVADVRPASSDALLDSLTAAQDRVFFQFQTNGPPPGLSELWVSDGTQEGTQLVRDILGP